VIGGSVPLRISFAGGGTDVERYAQEYGGMVVNAAVQKYITGFWDGEFTSYSDVPIGSGLGGSSAYTVLKVALEQRLNGMELAQEAYQHEKAVMGVVGGQQDYYPPIFGGLSVLTFDTEVHRQQLRATWAFESSLMLVHVGKRSDAEAVRDAVTKYDTGLLHHIKGLAEEMVRAMNQGNLLEIARIINDGWELKKGLSRRIANTNILNVCHAGLWHGALAGRLLGAGGGGYMMFLCEPCTWDKLAYGMHLLKLRPERVRFDYQGLRTWWI